MTPVGQWAKQQGRKPAAAPPPAEEPVVEQPPASTYWDLPRGIARILPFRDKGNSRPVLEGLLVRGRYIATSNGFAAGILRAATPAPEAAEGHSLRSGHLDFVARQSGPIRLSPDGQWLESSIVRVLCEAGGTAPNVPAIVPETEPCFRIAFSPALLSKVATAFKGATGIQFEFFGQNAAAVAHGVIPAKPVKRGEKPEPDVELVTVVMPMHVAPSQWAGLDSVWREP